MKGFTATSLALLLPAAIAAPQKGMLMPLMTVESMNLMRNCSSSLCCRLHHSSNMFNGMFLHSNHFSNLHVSAAIPIGLLSALMLVQRNCYDQVSASATPNKHCAVANVLDQPRASQQSLP